jgi:hypothetical protein
MLLSACAVAELMSVMEQVRQKNNKTFLSDALGDYPTYFSCALGIVEYQANEYLHIDLFCASGE